MGADAEATNEDAVRIFIRKRVGGREREKKNDQLINNEKKKKKKKKREETQTNQNKTKIKKKKTKTRLFVYVFVFCFSLIDMIFCVFLN